jgi:tetratricopeptide (TPR) repeat protein
MPRAGQRPAALRRPPAAATDPSDSARRPAGAGAAAPDAAAALVAGDAAMSRGDYTAAVQQYGAAVEADARSALVRAKRAAASAALGLHRAALRDLDVALDLDPASVPRRLQRCAPLRSSAAPSGSQARLSAAAVGVPPSQGSVQSGVSARVCRAHPGRSCLRHTHVYAWLCEAARGVTKNPSSA